MIAVIQVLVISILIAVGWFLAKKGIFTQETGKSLSFLLVNIVTPVLIINSFQLDYSPEKLQGLLVTFLLALLSFALVIAFSYLYLGRKQETLVERICVIFSNTGFMGLPLVAGMFGSEGVFYASIMITTFHIVYWTYGIALQQGRFSWKSLRGILLSPTILSVAVGLLFFLCRIRLPEPLHSASVHLANLNTPLAMLISGISISQSDLGSVLRRPATWRVLLGKLILAPVLVALVFRFLPVDPMIREVLVIQVGCPTAAIVGITALQCGLDHRSATEYFSITTICSMATIPLIKLFCGWLF